MLHLFFSSCLLLPLLLVPLFFILSKVTAPLISRSRSRGYNLPHGPPTLPIVGNLLELSHLPHISLLRLSQRYGSLIYLKLGHVPTVIASSKETAMEILKTQDLAFCSRPETIIGSKFSYGGLDIAFSPFNDHWKQLRKFSNAEIFSTARVQSFRPIREEEVGILMGTIKRDSANGKLINLSEMALCLFNNITFREVFGKRISADGECGSSPHHDMVMEVVALMGGFNVSDFFPSFGWVDFLTGNRLKLRRSFRQMDGLFEKEIEERLKTIDSHGRSQHQDFLDVLLLCQVEKDPTLGFLLSRDEIKALLVDMFFGGTATTAVTVVWGMTELMRNKSTMKKAQEEVRQAAGDKGRVDEDDLKQLHYLKMVIKETLRLHPPTTLLAPHACMKDTKIQGYDVPAKTMAIVNVWAIGRDSKYWDDPETFRPERFAEAGETENSVKGNNAAGAGAIGSMPAFGLGRRMCPGMTLGLASIELALANLLYSFDWTLPTGMTAADIGREERFGLSTRKKLPMLLMATPASA